MTEYPSSNASSTGEAPAYGTGDATYQAAGGLDGITRLVNRFYDNMERLPEAAALRAMHPEDLTESRQKLVFFLSGWMGGPKLYARHYGSISIPKAHAHLPVDQSSRDAWLHCMAQSLLELDYPAPFRDYLLQKLAIPAESIRLMCEFHQSQPGSTDP
ncbi:group II truncated hemoglobin [Haliea sp. E17]|uniref:group II truncated hemoglobin n=1 Tax=Haliea sp. E17 TaxID=3401576 RepID=UPI003AAB2FB2